MYSKLTTYATTYITNLALKVQFIRDKLQVFRTNRIQNVSANNAHGFKSPPAKREALIQDHFPTAQVLTR